MPEDILEELLAYLDERASKIHYMKEEGMDIESMMLASEQNMMGQQFKPNIEHEEPSEDENNAKMNTGKDMNEVGK
jgi:hypothetical protein